MNEVLLDFFFEPTLDGRRGQKIDLAAQQGLKERFQADEPPVRGMRELHDHIHIASGLQVPSRGRTEEAELPHAELV